MSLSGVDGPTQYQPQEGVAREEVEAKRAELAQAISNARNAVDGSERAEKIQALVLLLQNWNVAQYGQPLEYFLNIADTELGLNTPDLVGANIDSKPVGALAVEPELVVKPELGPVEKLGERIRDWNIAARDLIGSIQNKGGGEATDLVELKVLAGTAGDIDQEFIELPLADPANRTLVIELETLERIWSKTSGRRGDINELIQGLETKEKINQIKTIINRLTQLLGDASFRPTNPLSEFGGKTALEVIAEVRQRAGGLQITNGTIAELSNLEKLLANRTFEQWKLELETNHPELRTLNQLVAQANISLVSPTPDFSYIGQVETTLQTIKTRILGEVTGGVYEDYLESTYWSQANEVISQLKKAEAEVKRKADEKAEFDRKKLDAENESRKSIEQIRKSLIELRQKSIAITKDTRDAADKQYSPLLEALRKLSYDSSDIKLKEVVEELERDILVDWFKCNVKNYDLLLDFVEDKDILGAGNQYDVVEENIIRSMESIAIILDKIYKPEWLDVYGGLGRAYFTEVTKSMDSSSGARAALNFGWMKMSEHVITSDSRSVPQNVSSKDHLVITGEHVAQLVKNGEFDLSGVEGEKQNVVLGNTLVRRLPKKSDFELNPDGSLRMVNNQVVLRPGLRLEEYDVNGVITKVVIKEQKLTAVGTCMRIFDAVYRGDLTLRNAEGPIGVGDIHSNLSVLINYAHKRVNEIMGVDTSVEDWKNNEVVPKTIVVRSLRLNSIVPMHQSGLSDIGTTGRSDQWYYLWRWHVYAHKYIKEKKAKFSRLFSQFLVGSNENPLESIKKGYAGSVLEVVKDDENRLSNDDKLKRIEELGFSNFKFLANLPLFRIGGESDPGVGYTKVMENGRVVKKRRIETRFFQPPLAVLTLRDRFVNLDTKPPTIGRMVTFDDYRAMGEYKKTDEYYNGATVLDGKFVDQTGERMYMPGDEFVYEDMPWEEVKSKFMYEYVSELRSGPFPFWQDILYADQDKAMSSMGSASYVSDLRKTIGYAVPFTKVATKVRNGVKATDSGTEVRLDKAVQNQMVDVLIFAYCLTQTSELTAEDKRWGTDQLYDYLKRLYDNQAISFDEMLVLYASVVKGRRLSLFASGMTKQFKNQLETFFKFSA